MRLVLAALSLCLLALPASADTVVKKDGNEYRCPSAFGMTQSSRVFTCPSYKIENPESVEYLRDGIVGAVPPPPPPPPPPPAAFNLQAALDAAPAGGVVIVPPGVHKTTGAIGKAGITVRGADATSTIDCSGMRPAWGKACILFAQDGVVESLKITGAKHSSGNEACLRNEPTRKAVVKGVECWGSYNGVLGSGGSWEISDSYFHDNGKGDGLTHNLYFSNGSDRCASAKLKNVRSYGAIGGHALKTRCLTNEFASVDLQGSPDASLYNSEAGTVATFTGSKLIKANGSNGNVLTHGMSPNVCEGDLTFINSVIESPRVPSYLQTTCRSRIAFTNTPLPVSVQ